MIAITVFLGAVVVLLTIIAILCFRMSILHGRLARLNQLVADMLNANSREQQQVLAENYLHWRKR